VSVCFLAFLGDHNLLTYLHTRQNFTEVSIYVICGRGSVVVWRHDSAMLCTSGFVNYVSFDIMDLVAACCYRSSAVHGLTPLLPYIDCVLY